MSRSSQSCDKSKKGRRERRSLTKGGEECPRRGWWSERPGRPGRDRIFSLSLRQISLGRSSGRCDDCCVSLHRSGHPVDLGVGCGRELRGLPWRPPLPRHWQRCSIEPFWLLGRICFQPSCNLSYSRRPLRPPRAERVSWLFGKLIEIPDSLSIVDREWRKFCDRLFLNIQAFQWNWSLILSILILLIIIIQSSFIF